MSPVSGLLVDGRVPGTPRGVEARLARKQHRAGQRARPSARPAGRDGRSISGRGHGALLAILVLEAGQVVPAGRLTGLL